MRSDVVTGFRATQGHRHIVNVHDMDGAALCPAEAVLDDFPTGQLRGDLYPAARLPDGEYMLVFDGSSQWPVILRSSGSEPSAMSIRSDVDPPIGGTSG